MKGVFNKTIAHKNWPRLFWFPKTGLTTQCLLFIILMTCSCSTTVKTEYYENGIVKLEYETENGQINGDWKHYDSLGRIIETATYINGQIDGRFISYYPDHSLKAEYRFSNGVLNGAYSKYHENGKPNEIGGYINDTLNGTISTFDSSGNLVTTQTVCMGQLCGTYLEYYSSGGLYSSAIYGEKGVFEGPYKIYFENGILQEEGENLNGKVHGMVREYDSLGNLIKITEYFEEGSSKL